MLVLVFVQLFLVFLVLSLLHKLLFTDFLSFVFIFFEVPQFITVFDLLYDLFFIALLAVNVFVQRYLLSLSYTVIAWYLKKYKYT
jgi:hypothetical protein